METVGHWRVETSRVPINLFLEMLWVLLHKSRRAKSTVSPVLEGKSGGCGS